MDPASTNERSVAQALRAQRVLVHVDNVDSVEAAELAAELSRVLVNMVVSLMQQQWQSGEDTWRAGGQSTAAYSDERRLLTSALWRWSSRFKRPLTNVTETVPGDLIVYLFDFHDYVTNPIDRN